MHVDNTFALGVSKRIRPVPRTLSRLPSQLPALFVTGQGQGSLGPLSLSFSLSPATTRPLIQRPTGLGGCRLCLSSSQLVCPALEVSSQTTATGTMYCGTLFSSQRAGLLHSF